MSKPRWMQEQETKDEQVRAAWKRAAETEAPRLPGETDQPDHIRYQGAERWGTEEPEDYDAEYAKHEGDAPEWSL